MSQQRFTVILVPDENGTISASVPAMPGCFGVGGTREETLANVQDAIAGWIASEADQGREPLEETPAIVAEAVSQVLDLIAEMRDAGDISYRRLNGGRIHEALVIALALVD